MEAPKRLRILKLTSENFKKLKAVTIIPGPEQHLVQITGANEAGKSSVLDAIWSILEWAEAKKKIPAPIREGATSATNTIDLGDIIVSRTWTAAGSYLTVSNKAGAIFKSPQAVLDALKGQLSFDPLAFANMTDEAQKEIFMRITGLGERIVELDKEKQTAYDERTAVNREIRDLEGRQRVAQTAGVLEVVGDAEIPTEEIQVKDVLEKIGKAQAIITSNGKRRQDLDEIRKELGCEASDIQDLEIDLKELQKDLKIRQEAYARKQAKAAELAVDVKKLKDPEIEALTKEADGIDEKNKKVRAKRQYLEVSKQIQEKKDKVTDLEYKMMKSDTSKEVLFKTAKLPVDGMTIGAAGLLYKGVPFKQCSTAEKLRVSTAIAMAQNPTLRVIRINDGSLLDSKNLAEIERLAKENDYCIWMEQVDETGKVGVYIEDGEVKGK